MENDEIQNTDFSYPVKKVLEKYKGIKILWDADEDTRVYWAIDKIIQLVHSDQDAINSILWVGEEKGILTISYDNTWDGEMASSYMENFVDFDVPNGDFWIVVHEFPHGKYDYKKLDNFLFEDSSPIPPRIITSQIRYEVCKRQRWKCNSCHVTLKFHRTSEWEGELAHIDHIHPYADAMSYFNGFEKINEISNLQALCERCNIKIKRKTKS